MRYIAKESYLELKDDKNFNSLDAPSIHRKLCKGLIVEFEEVPAKIEPYLKNIDKPVKKSKKEDK